MQQWIVELLSDPEPSEILTTDSFTRLKLIHTSLTSEIFLVRKTATNELYALKSIYKSNSLDSVKALTERNALMKASSPFVVSLHATFQSESAFHLLLDFIPCGTLRTVLLARAPLAVAQAKLYLFEIALALGHLHGLGIVYRNLAPEHVLIDREGHTRLADLSRAYDAGAGTCDTYVTPYSAPEQCLRQRLAPAADWWAFGVLAFELFVGRRPLDGAAQPKMPPATDARVAAFVAALLQRDPARRLASVEEVTAHPVFAGFKAERALLRGYAPEFVPEEEIFDDCPECERQGSGLLMPGFSWNEDTFASFGSFPALG
jgi:serine/threonine protein kinase